MVKSHSKKDAPHPPRGSRRASPSPRFAGRGKETAARAAENAEINFDPESETLDADYAAFHKRKNALPEAESKAIEARFAEAFAKRRDAGRRWLNDYFMFWTVCTSKACKRVARCAGDASACAERWGPHVPARAKFMLQTWLKKSNEGLSPQDAWSAAEKLAVEWADHIAFLDVENLKRLRADEEARTKAAANTRAAAAQTPDVADRAAPSPATGREATAPLPRERGPRARVL